MSIKDTVPQAEVSVNQAKTFEQGSKNYVRPNIEILFAQEITRLQVGPNYDGVSGQS